MRLQVCRRKADGDTKVGNEGNKVFDEGSVVTESVKRAELRLLRNLADNQEI